MNLLMILLSIWAEIASPQRETWTGGAWIRESCFRPWRVAATWQKAITWKWWAQPRLLDEQLWRPRLNSRWIINYLIQIIYHIFIIWSKLVRLVSTMVGSMSMPRPLSLLMTKPNPVWQAHYMKQGGRHWRGWDLFSTNQTIPQRP